MLRGTFFEGGHPCLGPGDIPGQGWTPLFASLARPVKRPRRRKFSAQFGSIGQNEQLLVLVVRILPCKNTPSFAPRHVPLLLLGPQVAERHHRRRQDRRQDRPRRARDERGPGRGRPWGEAARAEGTFWEGGTPLFAAGLHFRRGGVAPCLRGDNIKFISVCTCKL